MTKATFTLPNGTLVTIEGESVDDIKILLDYYKNSTQPSPSQPKKNISQKKQSLSKPPSTQVDFSEIVNLVKNCDKAEEIERQILDKASQVNRTLLPLYIVHEHMNNSIGLTSGDVNKITTDLGIPISTSNASHKLSGTASRYVIGDQVRTKGQPVRYKLSRRGVQYMNSVISGVEDDNKE